MNSLSLVNGQGSGHRRSHSPKPTGTFNVQAKSNAVPSFSFVPLPPPNGPAPYRKDLSQILSASDYQAIKSANAMIIHTVGDTGDHRGGQKDFVAAMMTNDAEALGPQEPAFCYHLGDICYFAGDTDLYSENFYETYKDYPSFIVAISGNHDCVPVDEPSDREAEGAATPNNPAKQPWDGFIANFMADDPAVQGSPTTGAERTVMDLPNTYWTLTTPVATFIGLCSNVGETQAEIHQDQIDWFHGELTAADPNLPLVVAIHHPPFSGDVDHSGSDVAEEVLFGAFQATGRYPNLILSGHVHNYQRFTQTVSVNGQNRPITCVVSGNGGYTKLGLMQNVSGAPAPQPYQVSADLSLDYYDTDNYGFLRLSIAGGAITGSYIGAHYIAGENATGAVMDSFTC